MNGQLMAFNSNTLEDLLRRKYLGECGNGTIFEILTESDRFRSMQNKNNLGSKMLYQFKPIEY